MKHLARIIPGPLSFFAVLLIGVPIASAYVASSSMYRLQSDSINVGGTLSTSTSFRVEDTVGEHAIGTSSSATYVVKAGYQQMQGSFLTVTVPANVTLAPNIPSVSGGIANGLTSLTVTTDNTTGYSMSINSSASPALSSGANNFPNYVPAGADPDLAFSTPIGSSRFGFSPEGGDIVQRWKDDGSVCNAGVLDTGSACWGPLSTTPETIVSRSLSNTPSGTLTTIRFRAESGASNVQPAGSYTATTTITVIAN